MRRSIDFFRDEVRNGFYVPTAMKQAWAVSLDILREIDGICERNNISYFADWGTLLGAVRHGGFVPWDDDLDICMKREDYEKFRKIADDMLPERYCIHDYERKENHWMFLSRVVQHSRICFEEDYLDENYQFPWLVGVDIFLKDYLYPDEEKERERDKEILYILGVAEGIIQGSFNEQTKASVLKNIEGKYHVALRNISNKRELGIALYKLAESRMAEVGTFDSDKVGQIFPWVLKEGFKYAEDAASFSDSIRMPFEDTTVPVPVGYDAALKNHYGDYKKIVKNTAIHGYPFFETQKKEIERLLGAPYPGFTFDEAMLIRPEYAKAKNDMHGTEKDVNNDRKPEILFLTIGEKEWKSFLPYYDKEMEKDGQTVTVMPLDLFWKNAVGQVLWDEETNAVVKSFKDSDGKDIDIADWEYYDLSEHLPEKIYIQFSYDETNPLMTVPPVFYARNLRQFTGELIFVPIGESDDFAAGDEVDSYHLKYVAASPATVYADKVYLQKKGMKEHYVNALCDFAGESTKDIWENKIELKDL